MALTVPSLLNQAVSTSTISSITSGSFTPTANGLLIVVVACLAGNTNSRDVNSCSATHTGQGSFTQRVDEWQGANGRSISLSIWTSQTGSSPGSGTVTIGWSGEASTRTVLLVYEVTGHLASGPVGETGTNEGSSSTLTVTISDTPEANSLVFAAVAVSDDATPNDVGTGTGFTEANEVDSGGTSARVNLNVMYDLDSADSTADWSNLATVNNVGGAIEIYEDAAGPTTINLGAGSLTTSAQALAVQPGAVSIAMGSTSLAISSTGSYPNPTTFTDGYGGDVNTACDLQISSSWATYNGGTHPNLSFESGQRSLIRFDLSSIPADAECIDAILYLYHSYTAEGGGTVTIPVHSVSQANGDWIEGTKNIALASAGEPCWNAKEADGSGGVQEAWAGSAGLGTTGTDYESTAIGQFVFNSGSDIGVEFAVALDTERVKGWFGSSNTNYGITFVQPSSAGHVGQSDNSTVAYRPKLVVRYAVVSSDISINLGYGSITASGQSLGVQPGAVLISLSAAGITAAAQGLDAAPGAATISMGNGSIAAGAQAVEVTAGNVTVGLSNATITALGQAANVVPGEADIALGAANLASSAPETTLATGAVAIALGASGITAGAQGCTLAAGAVSVSMYAGGITASAQTLTVSAPAPGTVLINLNTATITAAVQAASLAAGAVSLALSAANLSASVQILTVSAPAPGITISLEACGVTATVQGLSTVPGEAMLSLGTGTITATGLAVMASAGTVPPTLVTLGSGQLSISGQAMAAAPGGVVIGLDPATVAAAALAITAASLIARFLAVTDSLASGLAVGDQQRFSIAMGNEPRYIITLEDEG